MSIVRVIVTDSQACLHLSDFQDVDTLTVLCNKIADSPPVESPSSYKRKSVNGEWTLSLTNQPLEPNEVKVDKETLEMFASLGVSDIPGFSQVTSLGTRQCVWPYWKKILRLLSLSF
ncbi:hypothetical protein F2Q70_00037532 [Brassica cretica]|uniref:Uncharacterized protein n=1 Tax=Brassica cretica TaxID=69181 RepID=A0A3N6RYC8_BRACR|nr:hypothetical protein F2Q70_00037532 [Brassica cretica]KAF3528540.1 hypothetical protein DY000_02043499 [Brassica cretica]